MSKAIIGVAVVIVLALLVWYGVSYYTEDVHTGCVVTDKDRARSSESGGSDARVYTKNCGVFHVSDAMLKGHFNSADTYSSIKVGHTYDFTTIGFRVPFLSMFPNIIEVNG